MRFPGRLVTGRWTEVVSMGFAPVAETMCKQWHSLSQETRASDHMQSERESARMLPQPPACLTKMNIQENFTFTNAVGYTSRTGTP